MSDLLDRLKVKHGIPAFMEMQTINIPGNGFRCQGCGKFIIFTAGKDNNSEIHCNILYKQVSEYMECTIPDTEREDKMRLIMEADLARKGKKIILLEDEEDEDDEGKQLTLIGM